MSLHDRLIDDEGFLPVPRAALELTENEDRELARDTDDDERMDYLDQLDHRHDAA